MCAIIIVVFVCPVHDTAVSIVCFFFFPLLDSCRCVE